MGDLDADALLFGDGLDRTSTDGRAGERSSAPDADDTGKPLPSDEPSEEKTITASRSTSRRRLHVLSPPPAKPAAPDLDWGSTAEEVDKMLRRALTVVEWQLSQDWVSNELRTNCSLCRRRFTRVYRRHHCRICGEVVCGKCSPFRARVNQTPSEEDRTAAHEEALAKIRRLESVEDRDSMNLEDEEEADQGKTRSATPPAAYSASDSETATVRDERCGHAEAEAAGPVKRRLRAQPRQKRVRICVKCYRKALAVHMSELEMVRREKGPEAVEAIWADWTKSCKYPSERRLQNVQASEAALVNQQKQDRDTENPRMSLSAAIHSRARSAPASPIGEEPLPKPATTPSPLCCPAQNIDTATANEMTAESKQAVAVLNALDSSYWSDGPEGRRMSPGEPHYVSPTSGSRRKSAVDRRKSRSWYDWVRSNVCRLVGVNQEASPFEIVGAATKAFVNDCVAAFIDNANAVGLSQNARVATGVTILFLFFPSFVLTGTVAAALVRVGVKYAGVVVYGVVQKPTDH